MSQKKANLASDHWAPAHPLVINAIVEANEGDAHSRSLSKKMQSLLSSQKRTEQSNAQ